MRLCALVLYRQVWFRTQVSIQPGPQRGIHFNCRYAMTSASLPEKQGADCTPGRPFPSEQPGIILTSEKVQGILAVLEFEGVVLASVAAADFDYPADFEVQAYDGRATARTGLVHRERTVTMGTGAFHHSVSKIVDILKDFFIAAIDLAQVQMADAVTDFHEKLDRIEVIDLGAAGHQGFTTMGTLNMDLDAVGHTNLLLPFRKIFNRSTTG